MLENFHAFRAATADSPLRRRGLTRGPEGQFEYDAINDKLPAVSWIIPTGAQSEHPDHMPAAGAAFVARKIDAIAANPEVWAKTVFILCYDENDGIFDHVAPPSPPPGTPHEFVKGVPIGAGFRVPCIIVSPWTAGGWVCSQPFDHFTCAAAPRCGSWSRLHRRLRAEYHRLAPPHLRRFHRGLPLSTTPRHRRPACRAAAAPLARALYESANLAAADPARARTSGRPSRKKGAAGGCPEGSTLPSEGLPGVTRGGPGMAAADHRSPACRNRTPRFRCPWGPISGASCWPFRARGTWWRWATWIRATGPRTSRAARPSATRCSASSCSPT